MMGALIEYHLVTILVVAIYTTALIGWGVLIRRVLSFAPAGLGFDAVLGIAGASCLGGLLNCCGLVSHWLMQAMLIAGIVAAAWCHGGGLAGLAPRWRSWRAEPLALLGLGVCLLLLVRALVLSDVRPFCDTDDYQAYLVYPLKMIANGSLGPDPYSARRIESALGGQYALDALLLGFSSPERLNAVDQGVGRVVLALLVWGLARRCGVSRGASLLPLALCLIVWPMLVNLTSVMTGMVLFIGLLYALTCAPDAKRLIVLSLISAGLCCLKSSHIPATVLMLCVGVLCDPRQSLVQRLRDLALMGAVTLLLLLPWMADMYRTTGTPLYPVLGRGHHGTAFGTYEKPNQGMRLRDFLRPLGNFLLNPLGMGILVLSALGLWRPARPGMAIVSATALAAVAAAALLFYLLTSGAERYTLAFLLPAFLVLAIHALAGSGPEGKTQTAMFRIALVATAFLLGDAWNGSRIELGRYSALAMPIPPYQDIHQGAEAMQRLQEGVPRGEIILARVSKPFQFDVTRNPIYLLDWPGGASPPPGLRTAAPAEEIARFLRDHGIRWLAYSYADEATFSHARHDGETAPDQAPWTRINAQHTLDFQDRLVELGRSYRHASDEGGSFILDLRMPAAAAARAAAEERAAPAAVAGAGAPQHAGSGP